MKCEACRAFYRFFATSLINSIIQSTCMNVRFDLSYDTRSYLKSCVLPYLLDFVNGRHFTTLPKLKEMKFEIVQLCTQFNWSIAC